jgi:hypothetical protein
MPGLSLDNDGIKGEMMSWYTHTRPFKLEFTSHRNLMMRIWGEVIYGGEST